MKRTQVAREVSDQLHTTEAALDAAIKSAEATHARMAAARRELGLVGTLGDAAVARIGEAVASMKAARAEMIEGHTEAYRIYEMLDLRDPTIGRTEWDSACADEDIRAA